MSTTSTTSTPRAIGPVGTLARVIVGCGLLGLAFSFGIRWYSLLLGLLLFPAIVLLFQRLRLHWTTTQLQATSTLAFILNNGLLITLFFIPYTAAAAGLFLGSSMLVAAVRGYAGCEVTAISNWILRRDDQVGCLLFSPIDAIDAKLR